MIKDLTGKEKEFLVEYCRKPENIELALAIGQIQSMLREAIVYFLKELDKSVTKKLEECGLHWETHIQKTNLEENENSLYEMSMEAQNIQIHLEYEKENLFVGIPKNETFPSPDALRRFLKDKGLKDSEEDDNPKWPWWIYPEESHKRVVALIPQHDDQCRREKIEYFTDELVRLAKTISKAPGRESG